MSSNEQIVVFWVDSSYKINKNKIVLFSLNTSYFKIILTSCKFYNYGIYSAQSNFAISKARELRNILKKKKQRQIIIKLNLIEIIIIFQN